MKPNLDTLKTEIEHHLEQQGLAVFYGYSRSMDSASTVYWDCEQYPDYTLFVKAAQSAGAKLMVLHQREFVAGQIEDALEELRHCELPREETREYEQRLSEMRIYDGFVCSIELSFDHEGRVYLFDLRTEWYDDLSGMLDDINLLSAEPGEDDPTMGGYFSRN